MYKIYTYYEPLSTDDSIQLNLIEIWKKSWTENGWFPIVLSIEDAKKHPKFEYYSKILIKKPHINVANYELACYYRWIAMANIGGGLMADYDCVNNGLKPENIMHYLNSGKMTCYAVHVPCLVSGSASEFERMIEMFLSFDVSMYKENLKVHSKNGSATSDMLIMANFPNAFQQYKLVYQYKKLEWEKATAIHFSSGSCCGNKTSIIKQFLNY